VSIHVVILPRSPPVKNVQYTCTIMFYLLQGECPFGNKCFYRHLSAEGVDVDIGPPTRKPKRQNAEGEMESARTFLLYNFLEERNGRYQVQICIP
jgi:hypothetical protein